MKKVINVGIGGRGFTVEEEAYFLLNKYLLAYRKAEDSGHQGDGAMGDIEDKVAKILAENLTESKNVVDMLIVRKAIGQLGMPDGGAYIETSYEKKNNSNTSTKSNYSNKTHNEGGLPKRLYRNSLDQTVGGVCSGTAVYLGIDPLVVRLGFVLAFVFLSVGFWLYVVLWVAVPMAETPAQLCAMHGLPETPENLNKFTR